MGTVVNVEAIPFSDPLSKIDIALVGEQLAELLLVGPVRSFHVAVELRCSRFDVDVPDPLFGYVSVEFCLELVSPIGSDRVSPERKLLGNVADEVDGVGLRVAAVNLQRANSRSIIDGRVRVPPHRRPFLLPQSQEFQVYLRVVARNLLLIAMRVCCAPSNTIGEPIETMTLADPVGGRVGCLDVVIPLQVPDDALRPHVVRPAPVQNLFYQPPRGSCSDGCGGCTSGS